MEYYISYFFIVQRTSFDLKNLKACNFTRTLFTCTYMLMYIKAMLDRCRHRSCGSFRPTKKHLPFLLARSFLCQTSKRNRQMQSCESMMLWVTSLPKVMMQVCQNLPASRQQRPALIKPFSVGSRSRMPWTGGCSQTRPSMPHCLANAV